MKSYIFMRIQHIEIIVTGRNDKSNIFRTLVLLVVFSRKLQ